MSEARRDIRQDTARRCVKRPVRENEVTTSACEVWPGRSSVSPVNVGEDDFLIVPCCARQRSGQCTDKPRFATEWGGRTRCKGRGAPFWVKRFAVFADKGAILRLLKFRLLKCGGGQL